MSAPTPTSALVHRSTLVVAGLVVVLHHYEMFITSGSIRLMTFVGWFTLLGGSLIALGEYSVKKLVAYRTLSQMGIATITFGLGQITLGYYQLISHGFLKCLLFLGVGVLIHTGYNQQEIRKNRPSVRGIVQGSIRFSLLSLCGLFFTRGMGRKEMLMILYSRRGHYVFFYSGIIFSVFLTFLYSFYL